MFCFSFLSLVLFSSISFSFDTTIKSNFDVSLFFIQKLTQNHSEDTGLCIQACEGISFAYS